jgi:hypothetical protein
MPDVSMVGDIDLEQLLSELGDYAENVLKDLRERFPDL